MGADSGLASGGVVNKTGTCLLALAAQNQRVAFYAVASRDKVCPFEEIELESGGAEEL